MVHSHQRRFCTIFHNVQVDVDDQLITPIHNGWTIITKKIVLYISVGQVSVGSVTKLFALFVCISVSIIWLDGDLKTFEKSNRLIWWSDCNGKYFGKKFIQRECLSKKNLSNSDSTREFFLFYTCGVPLHSTFHIHILMFLCIMLRYDNIVHCVSFTTIFDMIIHIEHQDFLCTPYTIFFFCLSLFYIQLRYVLYNIPVVCSQSL